MPAHGAARRSRRAAEEEHASFAHAHAATATGIRHAKPPLHDATSRDAASQCNREACADRITGNGTAPKAARNAPTPVQDVVLNMSPSASRKVAEGSVAHRANNYGCGQMRIRWLESFKDT